MALRIVYKDFNLSVQELLIDNNSLNIHHRNLEKLVTKFFKVKNALSPKLINYIFEVIQKKTYKQLQFKHFRSRKIRATKYGIETPYLGPKLWKLVPNEYKTVESLEDSKSKIKTWNPENCPCRLCKTYVFIK